MTQLPLTYGRVAVFIAGIVGNIGCRAGYIWKREEIVAGACLVMVQPGRAFNLLILFADVAYC